MTKTEKSPILFPLIAAYLILKCLWRLFLRSGSWPLPPWHYISMASDVLLLVVLLALKPSVPEPTQQSPIYARYPNALFWCAVTAGVVMILLRFTSDHGWWTGHLRNWS